MFISNSGSQGYTIANSLRLRSSASAYLSRTFGTPTNRNKWTWSAWVKRGSLGGTQTLLHGNGDNTANNEGLILLDSDSFRIYSVTGGTVNMNIVSSAVLRDPSAWYHLVAVFDSAQATAANRAMLYVNGVQLTSFSTNTIPAQNYVGMFNASGMTHEIGLRLWASDLKFDGYIAEQYFIDGQALAPSSFGQTDTNGVWVPKAYSGTYGTNGFYLKFNDGSSTTNLCLDRSGNGNNWTPTGISLTAGATYDWMTDTPTQNYCTVNPVVKRWSVASETFSNANLTVSNSGASNDYAFGTVAVGAGKWYWEATITAIGGAAANMAIGVDGGRLQSSTATDAVMYSGDGNKSVGGSGSAYGATYTTNDVIGVALDKDGGTVTFYKNNTSQGAITLPTSVDMLAMCSPGTTSGVVNFNFGQRPFTYTPPTGFKALCTANLPAVTIANPKKHFDAKLYVGNGATQNVTGIDFQPDLVWYKDRSVARDHSLFDVIRGASQGLSSNLTQAETTYSGVSGFLSNGFSLGNSVNGNANTETYVSWLWKANGAGVTNTSGSITSTVSANTTAGFSIVTYTGTGANATVGHGLGVTPAMIIVKCRVNGTPNWRVWHKSLGTTDSYLGLNQTAAVASSTTVFNSQSSTTFGIGTDPSTNSASAMVAYCFAEVPGFSRIGSYTGNGSTDGPFVFCGFRPRYVLIKASTGTSAASCGWVIQDTAVNTYNQETAFLGANASTAEQSNAAYGLDGVSNGFKLRSTNVNWNESGTTYIFAAFAENPFGGSNVAPATAR